MILPQALDSILDSRQLGYTNGYSYRSPTAWNRYGRWILAGVLVLIGIILFFLILCISKRRKRRAALRHQTQAPITIQPPNQSYNNQGVFNGPQPHNNNGGYNQAGYDQNYNQGQYAPPAGVPPGYSGGANNGYYGQQDGVTQPRGVYEK